MKKVLMSIMMLLSSLTLFANNNIKLKDIKNDNIVTLKEYKGKKYIKLWASWCPVCLATLPHTEELAKDKNKDFQVLTVVSPGFKGEYKEKDFKSWWKGLDEFKDVEVLLDNKGELIKKARLRGYPTNLFVNSKGDIEKVIPGPISNEVIKNIMEKIK